MDVISSARRQSLFTVTALTQSMVKDFKREVNCVLLTNFKDSTKTKIAFKEVRVFHYSKQHKGQVWAKYSMSPVELNLSIQCHQLK